MTYVTNRRPLPALVFLLALTLLTSLVWWRVLNRSDNSAAQSSCAPTPTQQVLPAPASITVTVLNSTTRTGLAKATAGTLTRIGFTVSRFGNDTGRPPIKGVGEIRYTADQREEAAMLAYYFPGAKMIARTSTDSNLIVSLGTKYTKVASAAAVQEALQRNKITVQNPRAQNVSPSASPNC